MLKPKVDTQNKEIPFGRPWINDDDRNAVMDVLRGHVLTHGPKCKEFEEKFSTFMGGGYSVTTSSCMAALHLSAIHFGFKPGDEVIVPSETHVATVHAVELVGAKPVFVDCELITGNIDVNQIEPKITSKTKGIFVVHFSGIPADMEKICDIANKHKLKVIEDCATTLGGFHKNKHVGLWGDAGCFSFYPVKHITTAEGGMLISKNESTAKQMAHFRAFSVDRTFNERKIPGVYDVTGMGLNYRMSEIQAALGCVQMQKISRNLSIRKSNFLKLKEKILKIKGVSHVLDATSADSINSHYCLIAVLDKSLHPNRNDILLSLTNKNIGCSVYYPQPVPRMKYYRSKYQISSKDYANASIISDGSVALPVGPHLNGEDMDTIASRFAEALGEHGS